MTNQAISLSPVFFALRLFLACLYNCSRIFSNVCLSILSNLWSASFPLVFGSISLELLVKLFQLLEWRQGAAEVRANSLGSAILGGDECGQNRSRFGERNWLGRDDSPRDCLHIELGFSFYRFKVLKIFKVVKNYSSLRKISQQKLKLAPYSMEKLRSEATETKLELCFRARPEREARGREENKEELRK